MFKYILGILVIALGAFMVIKTEWFVENLGYSEWAEAKFGGGGTRLMYKVVGILFAVGSVLAMTGALGEIVVGIFGNLGIAS